MKKIFLVITVCCTYLSVHAQVWGEYDSRTEYRNDAGLRGDAGAISGFFQTSTPVNYPAGATSYWHLLDIRHSNPYNNFAMQFAGSFYDQYVYVRKTADNPAQPWSRIVTESAGGLIDANSMAEGDVLRNVFARMSEGNQVGDGTYLGVKAYGTQAAFGSKSFSIEHHFYGLLNNAVNFYRGSGATGGYMTFATSDGTEKMRLGPSGELCLNTTDSKGYRLAVNGSAIFAKVVVKNYNNWPDYVFDSSYQLPSLDSVSAFIQANKHLPNMPSATTVEKDGHDLGEVQKQLLKKVEELTLYVLKQEAMIKEQGNKIEILEKKVTNISK